MLVLVGQMSISFLTEAAAREALASEIRDDLQLNHDSKERRDELAHLYESIRSLIRSGSTVSEMTTRRIAHEKWCTTWIGKNGPCPNYDGAVGTTRVSERAKVPPWDFVMNFSSNSLMGVAMVCIALVGSLTGMFLRRRLDFWQVPLGLAAGFTIWLVLWGTSGILSRASAVNLNPFSSAVVALAAGLSTDGVFRTLGERFKEWLARTKLPDSSAKSETTEPRPTGSHNIELNGEEQEPSTIQQSSTTQSSPVQ